MPLDLVQTLGDLVALPSVNPMGRAAEGPEYFEARVSDYLQALFARWKLPCVRQSVAPRRDNVVVRLDGDPPARAGGKLLLFEAHQDTVPVAGMTIDPFRPETREGKLYGRGACDVKGGLTAMLGAVARLAEERPAGMPTIVLAATVNEEFGFTGATALEALWTGADSFLPRRPDAAIVAEPTRLDVVVAHKGVVRWRCHTLGRAAHSSQPQQGDSAIYRMAPVLAALEKYQRELTPSLPEHPRCGRPTLSVGTIAGGLSVNTVPDRVTIEIDRRICPGEGPDGAYRHVIDYLARECGPAWPIQHEPPFLVSRSLADDRNGPLAEALCRAAQRAGVPGRVVGVPYGTDASAIAAAGVPAVVFGPGSIDQAHTADEWIELDQLSRACEVLYRFGRAGWVDG